MPGPWRAFSQEINSRKMYIAGRQIDPKQPLHGDDQEIRISLDGSQWCALRGEDLQTGEAGFGPTPEAALADLINTASAPEFEAVRQTLEKIQELAVHPGVKCRGKDCRLCPAGVSEGRILGGCALLSIYSVAMRQLARTQQEGS